MDADKYLAGSDFGNGDGLEADVIDATVDCGVHGCRDRP
jgi:hypothetical protein